MKKKITVFMMVAILAFATPAQGASISSWLNAARNYWVTKDVPAVNPDPQAPGNGLVRGE